MSVYSYLGMSTIMMIAMTINDDDDDGGGGGDNGDTNDNGNSKSVADVHDINYGVDMWC